MTMEPTITILGYSPEYRSSIRSILTKIGWAEQYISGMENAADVFSKDKENYGMYLAVSNETQQAISTFNITHGINFARFRGLPLAPSFSDRELLLRWLPAQRNFPVRNTARGIYVDTPTTNTGGRKFYEAIGYQLGYIVRVTRRWIGWGHISKIL